MKIALWKRTALQLRTNNNILDVYECEKGGFLNFKVVTRNISRNTMYSEHSYPSKFAINASSLNFVSLSPPTADYLKYYNPCICMRTTSTERPQQWCKSSCRATVCRKPKPTRNILFRFKISPVMTYRLCLAVKADTKPKADKLSSPKSFCSTINVHATKNSALTLLSTGLPFLSITSP